jgi:hypothetical protein
MGWPEKAMGTPPHRSPRESVRASGIDAATVFSDWGLRKNGTLARTRRRTLRPVSKRHGQSSLGLRGADSGKEARHHDLKPIAVFIEVHCCLATVRICFKQQVSVRI